jgi:hypothetical protein
MSSAANLSPSFLKRIPFAHIAWVVLMVFGFGSLISYQMKAGTSAVAPDAWPLSVGLGFDPQHYNLVMFAHPKCSCTDASLEELKIVMTRGRGKIVPTICFFDPEGVGADWTQTALVRAAREIPGLNVVIDRNGSIAGQFGATTSGQVLMFDGSGKRVFAGGITASRGHAGENRGRSLVLGLVNHEISVADQTPVFGCGLHDPDCPAKSAL